MNEEMQTYLIRAVAIICKLNMRTGRCGSDLIWVRTAVTLKVGDSSIVWSRITYIHGFRIYLLSGRKKHVTSVVDPVPGISSEFARDPTPGATYQVECTGAHWRRWTHVHQQSGHSHQIPRLQVRLWLSLSCILSGQGLLLWRKVLWLFCIIWIWYYILEFIYVI